MPIVSAVVVAGLQLEFLKFLWLYHHVDNTPVELYVEVLRSQLRHHVFLFVCLLVLQVLDLLFGLVVLFFELGYDLARGIELLLNVLILSICLEQVFFLSLLLLSQLLGDASLLFQSVAVGALGGKRFCLLLLELLAANHELAVHFGEHLLEGTLLLLLPLQLLLAID